jgi:hypothetical protein
MRLIEGGRQPLTHGQATARVRRINRELGELECRKRALVEELDWAMEEQRRHIPARPSRGGGE